MTGDKTWGSLRAALIASSAAIALAVSAQQAVAQDEGAEEDEDDYDVVVVTGSRIARDPNLGGALPVQSIDAEQIRLSGEIDIADVINDIPALLTTTTSAGSVDGIFATSVGQTVLQLRGLGPERTLTLVDGRRHVGGVAGSASVDVGSIPPALVERVEVLTGGASAIYGADAVTGVVNFILKDDFEGLDFDIQAGLSGEGDGESLDTTLTYGKNFDDGRGNFTVSANYSLREEILFGDRDFSRNNGIADDLPNPALRFQQGDITGSTPNFQQFFNLDNGFFPTGFRIPSANSFVDDYIAAFGVAPNLTPEELALIARAENSPTRAIRRQPAFSISSNRGVILPANLTDPGTDLDGNGVSDCLQSSVGYNSLFDFAQAFGFAGGCYVVNDDGSVRPYQDGQIAGLFNQFGGDGIQNNFNQDFLVPQDQRFSFNVTGRYDLTPEIRAFFEGKVVYQETEFGGPLNTFYDLLTVSTDNPFIPPELQGVADAAGGLFITRDPTDLGPNINKNERLTYRLVGGIEGTFDTDNFWDGWSYEISGNYGRFKRTLSDRNRVIQDRWFAAIDVTTDANGNPICRSDIDPTAPPTTPFGIPLFDPGFFTFNPGDGSCRPANILGGPNSISKEAVNFVTTTIENEFELEQMVFFGVLNGTLEEFFTLPGGGAVGFAAGAEYRREESTSTFDPLVRGVLPIDIPDVTGDGTTSLAKGTLIRDVDAFGQNSLVFDPESIIQNAGGDFDVYEVFGEVSIPLLREIPFFHELTVDAATRYSDYSTVGKTVTWKAGGVWAPIPDIRFRGVYSKAVRAPNIDELFSPAQSATFRPVDPCEQDEIDALLGAGDPRGANRVANCAADGLPAGFTDPLSARFTGETVGNPDLQEETAFTYTAGAVIQPRFIDGLYLTADYWNIRIEDAISTVSAQDIVDNCYDTSPGGFPNQFCGLFTRNRDPNSAQFLGFNFLSQTELNFAALETAGIDFSARYEFEVGAHAFNVGVSGTYVFRLDEFFDPGDPTAVDPELGELQRPQWAGNLFAQWIYGPLSVNWQTQYQGEQGLRAVEIEAVDFTYGEAGIVDEIFIHDIAVSFAVNEQVELYGGINNLTNEEPFITEQAFPVNPLGRYFFIGASYRL